MIQFSIMHFAPVVVTYMQNMKKSDNIRVSTVLFIYLTIEKRCMYHFNCTSINVYMLFGKKNNFITFLWQDDENYEID